LASSLSSWLCSNLSPHQEQQQPTNHRMAANNKKSKNKNEPKKSLALWAAFSIYLLSWSSNLSSPLHQEQSRKACKQAIINKNKSKRNAWRHCLQWRLRHPSLFVDQTQQEMATKKSQQRYNKGKQKSWYWLWWSLTTCHFPSSRPRNSPFPKQLNKNQPKNNNQPKTIATEAKEALER
jgi:hypothetical protein